MIHNKCSLVGCTVGGHMCIFARRQLMRQVRSDDFTLGIPTVRDRARGESKRRYLPLYTIHIQKQGVFDPLLNRHDK